jgi:hypothetical protein
MLAHGLEVEAGARLAEVDDRHDDEQIREIDHRGLVEEQIAQKRDVLEARDADAVHKRDLRELGAGAEIDPVDERRQGGREDVDGHAVDDLVGAEGDGGEGVDHVDRDADERARQDAEPGAAGDEADEKPTSEPMAARPSRPMLTMPARSE